MRFRIAAIVLVVLSTAACRKADPHKIFEYVNNDDAASLKRELQKGIDPEDMQLMLSADPYSPLHAAAVGGNVEIARLLIDAGFDVNAKSKQGSVTPLWAAASGGKDGVVTLLLQKGADPDAGAEPGHPDTALDGAALSGHVSTVELLLKLEPDKDQHRTDALISAAQNGHLDVVKVLWADPKTHNGAVVAAQMADASGHADVVKFLEDNNSSVGLVMNAIRRR